MTDLDTLHSMVGRWVTVTHPDAPTRVWHGRLAGVWNEPSITLELPGGGQQTLLATFHVEPTAEPGPAGPDSEPLPFAALRHSGLLWLINRVAFHPRGLALALHCDDIGEPQGWSLLASDEDEPWQFDLTTDYDGYRRAEATLAAVRTRDTTCAEHPGRCFPELAATCCAHGDQRCAHCHRNPGDCITDSGNCSTWSRTGMHWDTCESRVFGPLTAPTPEAHTLPADVLVHNALVKSAPTVLGSKLAGPLRTEHYDALTRAVVAAIKDPSPPRLLDCGLCYEENGEEVHPHPECPIVTAAADAIGTATGGIVRTPTNIGETGCDLTIPYAAALREDNLGPAAPGIPRCNATLETRYQGIAACWRRADHSAREGAGYELHVGETDHGGRYQWGDTEPGTTPHRPDCTATFLEPFHGLAHCEQHADRNPAGRPGPWHEGTSEDGSRLFWKDGEKGAAPHRPNATQTGCTATLALPTESLLCDQPAGHWRTSTQILHRAVNSEGVTRVWLDGQEGAAPHRRDTVRTVQDTRPDTDDTARTPAIPDTDAPDPTSTDTVRTGCPDTSADTPDGVRMLYTARVPRAQMGAAWAEGLGHLHQLLAGHQADAADQPAQDTPATADDKPRPATTYDLTLGPDSLTDTERERKTILDTLNAELSNDEPEAVWALTLDIQRALEAMPRYADTTRLGAAAQQAAPANDERLGTPENAHIRLGLARQVLVDDGYFTDDQVGPDLAPRLVEWLSHHRGLADAARKEVDVLRARVGELAATLAETIGHFTIPANLNGAVLRTGYVPAATVERWRRVHTGNGPTGWMFPPVHGRCPACNRGSLFLGSGGYVSCSHLDCPNPEAPTDLLDNHEALAEAEERARRYALAYEGLRCDVITAAAYIRQQKDRVGPFSSLRHSRSRILTVLPTWIKDPGPLDPPATPTEER